MPLRAKKPSEIEKRLKCLLSGSAGTGKTTFALNMPKPYVIDCERGAENYADIIAKSEGVLYQTSDIDEVIAEIRSLLTEKHEYRTLVIDPITPVYQDLLDKAEKEVGTEWGRHYGEANKHMKRLFNLILALDMNVIITAHSKNEYGDQMVKLGETFDGWKRLDYQMDLWLHLSRQGKKRMARVRKTRITSFVDGDAFEWSYEALKERYDAKVMERPAEVVPLAGEAEIQRLNELLEIVKVASDWEAKCLKKANVDTWADMTVEQIGKCILYLEKKKGK